MPVVWVCHGWTRSGSATPCPGLVALTTAIVLSLRRPVEHPDEPVDRERSAAVHGAD
jgi:hypothetical protein